LTLGFSVPFYDDVYSDVYVGTNGYASFGRGYTNYALPSIPSRAPPNNAVYASAGNLRSGGAAGQGGVYYSQLDSPRRFVVEWNQVPHYDGLDPITFEIVFYETGEIEVLYLVAGYYTALVGIENANGFAGISYPTPPTDNLAIRFTPPTPPPGSAGVRIAPCAQGSSAVPGTTQSTPLIVTNAGTANDTIDLAFSASPGWSGDWYASDDATPLGDSDGDGLPDTGLLEPGASVDVFLRMAIPANATGSQTVNVTGTSTVDPSIDDTSMIGFSFPIALFDPPQSDIGIDVNRNGQFDSLDVNITITVRSAWTFLLFVELYDPTFTLDLRGDVILDLSPGTTVWTTTFEGWMINRTGADGPYLVDFWLLAGFYPAFLDIGAHQTRAYGHLDFEAIPTLVSRPRWRTPTIDGGIADSEWNDSAVVDLSKTHEGYGLPAFFYVKNDDTMLYVAYDAVGDDTIDRYDVASIGFDTGSDRTASDHREDQFVQGGWAPFNQGHYVFDASFAAWRLQDSPYDPSLPNEAGLASAWGFGASPNSQTPHRMYEFAVPLVLLGVRAGDTIAFAGGGQISPGVYDDYELRWSDWPEWTFGPQPLYAYGDLVLAGDTNPPNVTILRPYPGQLTDQSSVEVAWSASDVGFGLDHIEVRLDGGLPMNLPPSSTSASLTNLSDGSHTIEVTAVDRLGNTGSQSVVVRVDTTAPVLSIRSPQPNGIVTTSSAMVSWASSDATSGIAHVEIAIDDGPPLSLLPTARSYQFDGLADGSHTIVVTVVDRAGNSATASIEIQVRTETAGLLDPFAPIIVLALVATVSVIAIGAFAVHRKGKRARPPSTGG